MTVRRGRAALLLTFLAALAVSGPVGAQSVPGVTAPPADPVCDLAFELAASAATQTSPGLPSPPPLLPVGGPGLAAIDVTIRACPGLAEWATGAAGHPGALAGRDALLVLLERCSDPAAGLAALPVCAGISEVPASAAPSPIAAPSATAIASASPVALPSPSASPSVSPSAAPTESPTIEASTPRLVRLPRFGTRVRGADRVRPFAIRGSSPEELLRAMEEGATRVCPQHASACTLTQPRIRPRVLTDRQTGSCRVTGLQVSADDTVHLPRWSGPRRVFPELVAWWRKVDAHVRWHEAQHIKISQRHLASLRKRIVGKSCQRINIEVQRMSQQLNEAQAAFDMSDQGWLPPYDGPLP